MSKHTRKIMTAMERALERALEYGRDPLTGYSLEGIIDFLKRCDDGLIVLWRHGKLPDEE